jgi:hypothetical protein
LFMVLEMAVMALLASDGWNLVGDARWRGKVLQLTPAERQQAGAAWGKEKVAVVAGFDVEFRFQITRSGGLAGGADGIALVVQNTGPGAIAGPGGAGGFAMERPSERRSARGPIGRSVAVFFDTHENADANDPSDNYVGIYTFGRPEKAKWPPPLAGYSERLKVKLKDGREHLAAVSYRPPLLTVKLDGAVVLSKSVELRTVADEEGKAWVGFTASTGNGWGVHDVLGMRVESVESVMTSVDSQISFAGLDCLAGRNLCTPREGSVEERGEGVYAVVLPGHLEWGASVPNAQGREVEIRKGSGYVCWGEGDCGGPAGMVRMKTEGGRTYFGVVPKGGNRTKNEGYFVLEVLRR